MCNFIEISQQIATVYEAPPTAPDIPPPSPFCYCDDQPTLIPHMPGLGNGRSRFLAPPRTSALGRSSTCCRGQRMLPRINFPPRPVLSRTGPRKRFGGEVGDSLVWKLWPMMGHREILGSSTKWKKGRCHFVGDTCCWLGDLPQHPGLRLSLLSQFTFGFCESRSMRMCWARWQRASQRSKEMRTDGGFRPSSWTFNLLTIVSSRPPAPWTSSSSIRYGDGFMGLSNQPLQWHKPIPVTNPYVKSPMGCAFSG